MNYSFYEIKMYEMCVQNKNVYKCTFSSSYKLKEVKKEKELRHWTLKYLENK